MGRNTGRIAIETLIADYHADVYRFAFHLSGLEADAEDLTQEVFLSAHRRLDQLRDTSKARSWLLKITRNCFLQALQRRRRLNETTDYVLDELASEVPDATFDMDQLRAALDDLPDAFRLVVLMHYFEFLSYQEIANELEMPIGTVMSRLARAKQRLRQSMTRPAKVPG
ncbi:MAG: sigma-70 family RNA polymerase sigma factor [Pirellulales bacterium]|nr:sigma-70 family RNA polymerase sigma factor [Pirellulales bacterium]